MALLPTLIRCGCVRLRWRWCKKNIGLVGMRLMGAMEVQSVLTGTHGSAWKDFITEQAKWTREVAKWQQIYRVEWAATDGCNGGAGRIVWEMLLEMDKFNYHAGERSRNDGIGP